MSFRVSVNGKILGDYDDIVDVFECVSAAIPDSCLEINDTEKSVSFFVDEDVWSKSGCFTRSHLVKIQSLGEQ